MQVYSTNNKIPNQHNIAFKSKKERCGNNNAFKIAQTNNLALQATLGEKNLETLTEIAMYAKGKDVPIFLAGGAVRDSLLGKSTNDLDVIVGGDAVDFCIDLKETNNKFKHIKVKHKSGRATLWNKGMPIDFSPLVSAKAQSKSGFQDRLTLLLLNNLKDRDFTINAMVIKLDIDEKGKLKLKFIDKMNGKHDLKKKVLKCVTPESLSNDPVRILRGARLKLRFGLKMDGSTLQLQKECLKGVKNKHDCFYYRAVREICRIFSDNHNVYKNIRELLMNNTLRVFH